MNFPVITLQPGGSNPPTPTQKQDILTALGAAPESHSHSDLSKAALSVESGVPNLRVGTGASTFYLTDISTGSELPLVLEMLTITMAPLSVSLVPSGGSVKLRIRVAEGGNTAAQIVAAVNAYTVSTGLPRPKAVLPAGSAGSGVISEADYASGSIPRFQDGTQVGQQLLIRATSKWYRWDGLAWIDAFFGLGTIAAKNYTQSELPPTNPVDGDQWFDTSSGIRFERYDGAWVDTAGAAVTAGSIASALGYVPAAQAATPDLGTSVFKVTMPDSFTGDLYWGFAGWSAQSIGIGTAGYYDIQELTSAGGASAYLSYSLFPLVRHIVFPLAIVNISTPVIMPPEFYNTNGHSITVSFMTSTSSSTTPFILELTPGAAAFWAIYLSYYNHPTELILDNAKGVSITTLFMSGFSSISALNTRFDNVDLRNSDINISILNTVFDQMAPGNGTFYLHGNDLAGINNEIAQNKGYTLDTTTPQPV